jgi:hypothetical protein
MNTSHCHACRGLLPTSQYAPAGPAIPRRLKMPGEKPFLRSRTALGRYQLLFCGHPATSTQTRLREHVSFGDELVTSLSAQILPRRFVD